MLIKSLTINGINLELIRNEWLVRYYLYVTPLTHFWFVKQGPNGYLAILRYNLWLFKNWFATKEWVQFFLLNIPSSKRMLSGFFCFKPILHS